MEPIEVNRIHSFIEMLSKRAHLGICGEKPLAMLAIIEYIYYSHIEGKPAVKASISELLSNKLTSNAIRVKFLELANKTGKLKAPETSWGNIITYKKELINELHKHKSVDKALQLLSKDQAEKILKHYYHKMGLEIKNINHFEKA